VHQHLKSTIKQQRQQKHVRVIVWWYMSGKGHIISCSWTVLAQCSVFFGLWISGAFVHYGITAFWKGLSIYDNDTWRASNCISLPIFKSHVFFVMSDWQTWVAGAISHFTVLIASSSLLHTVSLKWENPSIKWKYTETKGPPYLKGGPRLKYGL